MDEKTRKRLSKMARHAYETVPFYQMLAVRRGLNGDFTFEQLPIIDKKQLIESGASGISSKYIGAYIRKELKWTRTSGSSGLMSEVYWDEREERKSLFSLWLYRRRFYGILPDSRLCYFFPSDQLEEASYRGDYFFAVSRKCLYDGNLEKRYHEILEYDPEWMILQPSIAAILCALADKHGTPKSLKYIEFTGEYLETGVRKRVERIFGCRTANQYGTKEVNSIAYECPCGKLHVMSDNVFLEMEGENFCVTSLQNYVMPYVRYRLEDRGRLFPDRKCNCGIQGDIIEIEAGRSNDMIRMKDGTARHPYILAQIIHALNYQCEGGILQYQICQEDYSYFVVRLVLEEIDQQDEIQGWLLEQFRERFGEEVEVEFIIVDTIFPERNGKIASFYSLIDLE